MDLNQHPNVPAKWTGVRKALEFVCMCIHVHILRLVWITIILHTVKKERCNLILGIFITSSACSQLCKALKNALVNSISTLLINLFVGFFCFLFFLLKISKSTGSFFDFYILFQIEGAESWLKKRRQVGTASQNSSALMSTLYLSPPWQAVEKEIECPTNHTSRPWPGKCGTIWQFSLKMAI